MNLDIVLASTEDNQRISVFFSNIFLRCSVVTISSVIVLHKNSSCNIILLVLDTQATNQLLRIVIKWPDQEKNSSSYYPFSSPSLSPHLGLLTSKKKERRQINYKKKRVLIYWIESFTTLSKISTGQRDSFTPLFLV